MTISAWPLDAVNGAPTYSGRKLRQTNNAPTFAGATAARPLGALSGVRPGTSTTTVTATSTAWSCAPLAGVIDGEAAAEAGPYTFASDSVVTGSVNAANASNPRVDIIYVQVSDPAEADGSTVPGVKIDYLAGTAASTPAAPAAPARSFVLAQINVPKSGGGSPSVTWVAPVAVAAGGVRPVDTLANLNLSTGYSGALAYVFNDGANNALYTWTGTTWGPLSTGVTGTVTAKSGFSIQAGTTVTKNGNWVRLYLHVTGSYGNLTNYDVATISSNCRPTAVRGGALNFTGSSFPSSGGVQIGTDGTVTVYNGSGTHTGALGFIEYPI